MNTENLVIPRLFSEVSSLSCQKLALQIKKEELWQSFSYKETELYSLKVGAFLIKEGFKKNTFAAIILENRPEWPIIYLGIMYAGLTAVPLDSQLSAQEIKDLISDSQAKIIFCSESIFTNKIKAFLQDVAVKVVVLDTEDKSDKNYVNFSDIEQVSVDNITWPAVLPEDIASLIYTSGTTAKPKGVLLSHKNICSNFMSIHKLNICFSSDNMLSILPLYHTYAFMVTLITPLFLGATITYCSSFKPQDISQIIKEGGVSVLVGVPQLFSLLHKAIFENLKKIPALLLIFIKPLIKIKLRRYFGTTLRLMVSGGARLEPRIARDLAYLGFKLIEGYGLTETSPVVTLNPPKKIKFGSVGKPIPDVFIKIANPDKSGIGGVLIKGPNVMQGYFKQPDLTAQIIKEDWFYSGDLGYLDKEGYLFLVGREKEVIILSSGKNIYPEELEEYYLKSPYIKEMCILSRQEERFGLTRDSLYAVVVPNLEYFRKMNETNIQGKIRWEVENLSRDLPSYKHIMGFTLTKEELPRTILKKIKRYQVKQKYLDEEFRPTEIKETISLKEDSQGLDEEITKKIVDYITKETTKPIRIDSHLEIDLGIDSLTRVQLGLGLEALLKIKIPDELLYRASTVRDIIVNIQDLMKGPQVIMDKTEVAQKSWNQILSQLPPEKMLKKIRIRAGFLDSIFTLILKGVLLFIFRIFWRLKIQGKESLSIPGPYFICSNHASYLDGFTIFSSLPLQRAINTFFLGYSEIFEHPLISWSAKIGRFISIDPNIHLTEAMRASAFVVRHKKIVCIFPEGRRSIDENIGEFKKGIGILIKELDIPVIPVYIKGSHQSWPRTSRFPRLYPLKVFFGQPISPKKLLKDTGAASFSDDYEAIAQRLREEVLKLAC